LQWL